MSLTKRMNRIPYGRMLFAVAVGVTILIILKTYTKTSTYAVNEKSYAELVAPIGPSPQGMAPVSSDSTCEMQNFLEPRSQIGMPETTGGALRNANQSIRAEPPNPKEAFMWNNSTISTDSMQRPLV